MSFKPSSKQKGHLTTCFITGCNSVSQVVGLLQLNDPILKQKNITHDRLFWLAAKLILGSFLFSFTLCRLCILFDKMLAMNHHSCILIWRVQMTVFIHYETACLTTGSYIPPPSLRDSVKCTEQRWAACRTDGEQPPVGMSACNYVCVFPFTWI